MAPTRVRSTYALDLESVRILERLAKQWGVSKSEALRRSIQTAAGQNLRHSTRLQAFEELQRSVGLSKAAAERWQESVRKTRRSSSAKRLSR